MSEGTPGKRDGGDTYKRDEADEYEGYHCIFLMRAARSLTPIPEAPFGM